MYQTDFSIDELKMRRDRLCETIGDAVAIIPGADSPKGSVGFRQYNDFYYCAAGPVISDQ